MSLVGRASFTGLGVSWHSVVLFFCSSFFSWIRNYLFRSALEYAQGLAVYVFRRIDLLSCLTIRLSFFYGSVSISVHDGRHLFWCQEIIRVTEIAGVLTSYLMRAQVKNEWRVRRIFGLSLYAKT